MASRRCCVCVCVFLVRMGGAAGFHNMRSIALLLKKVAETQKSGSEITIRLVEADLLEARSKPVDAEFPTANRALLEVNRPPSAVLIHLF